MIIVFGSNVLDLFFHRADLPARDTAVFLDRHDEAPGGKGANQAVAAARAGAEVRFYGALGEGGHGRQMYKNLAKYGIDVSGVKFLEDVPSGLATIFIDEKDGTHRIVVSQGANLKATQDSIPDKILTRDSVVLVQGELPMAQTETLIKRAHKKGCRTVMNLAPASHINEDALKALDIIVLNEYEAETLGKQLGMEASDKMSFAAALYARFQLTTIVTLGPDGAVCCGPDGLMTVNSLPIKAVDTVGAGDAFVGFLTAGLSSGLSLADSLRQASVAGSLACTKVGAQTALPNADEVRQHLSQVKVTGGSANQSKAFEAKRSIA